MCLTKLTALLFALIIASFFLFTSCDSSGKTPPTNTYQTSTTITNTNLLSPTSLSVNPSLSLPPGTELKFETIIQSGNLGGSYKGESAQIKIFSSIQTSSQEGLEWVNPEYQNKILEVDYSKYFVVMIFNGYRGGIFSNLKIQIIWQNAGTIFLLAHFNDFMPQATALSAYNSQYQVVKIDKTQITQTGVVSFKLLDETGQVRAIATVMI